MTTSSTRDVDALVRPELASVVYSPVESLQAVADEVGLPLEHLVKLDANENVYGALPAVRDALAKSLLGDDDGGDNNNDSSSNSSSSGGGGDGGDDNQSGDDGGARASQPLRHTMHVYPDPNQRQLRAALARLHNVSATQVVTGSGSDDVLDVLIRLLGPSAIVVAQPTFGMYSFLGRLASARIVDAPRDASTFDVDVDAVVDAAERERASLVFLPSPNNPTGNVVARAHVRSLCTRLARRAVICIDEAYGEFAGDASSAVALLAELPNLVVTRTFSKWAGLAGLRVGYALATPSLATRMMAIKQPYNVTAPSSVAALVALEHRAAIMHTVDALCRERDRLHAELERFDFLQPCRSSANFVLVRVLAPYSAARLRLGLRRAGVLVRYFGSQGGALADYVRISAGRPEHTDAVVATLRAIVAGGGAESLPRVRARAPNAPRLDFIVFDMDGVLADVSESYRSAIVRTAAAFDVAVTDADIARAKNAGDANNDWLLTHRLVHDARATPADARGTAEPTLETVTVRFEQLYQGDDDAGVDGLYRTERMIVDRALLERLAARVPLAVVTGRPRHPDMQRFLRDHNIAALFSASVCMGETPLPKPDAQPVRDAAAQLGFSLPADADDADDDSRPRAVMIGDTVDDVRAARAAGIRALGVIAPGTKDVDAARQALLDAGAEAILAQGLAELEEYL